jgi:hypothetical protein
MLSLLRAYILSAEDVMPVATGVSMFPPPECELAAEYEFADHGEVLTVTCRLEQAETLRQRMTMSLGRRARSRAISAGRTPVPWR